MKKVYSVLLVAFLVLCAAVAIASEYEACISNVERAFTDCTANANQLANDIEIQEAAAVCNKALADTRQVCDDAEAARVRAEQPAPEDQEVQPPPDPPQSAPEPPQEPPQPEQEPEQQAEQQQAEQQP